VSQVVTSRNKGFFSPTTREAEEKEPGSDVGLPRIDVIISQKPLRRKKWKRSWHCKAENGESKLPVQGGKL